MIYLNRALLIALLLSSCKTNDPIAPQTGAIVEMAKYVDHELGAITQRQDLQESVSGRLTGHILHVSANTHIRDYEVTVEGGEVRYKDGNFEITLPEGSYEVDFNGPDIEPITLDLEFTGGIEQELLIRVDGEVYFKPE